MKLRAETCLCIATLLLIGAASPADALSPGLPKNKDCNEEVFQNALNELRSKDYEQGRRLLTKLVGRKCSLAPAAMLLIADAYYREGGSRNLAEAEQEYARWLELFPEQDLAPLVMKKTVEVHLRELNGRDGSNHLESAYRALLKLQESYPLFSADAGVQEYEMVTEELRAEHNLKVARYYLEVRESPTAAKMRCQEILRKTIRFSKTDSALWYLAQADEILAQTEDREDNLNEAIAAYRRIVSEYAAGEHRDRAIERMRFLGEDPPEPNPRIIAWGQERAAKARSILADIDGYVLGISRRGILLNEEDEAEAGVLNEILKEANGSSSTASQSEPN